MVVRHWWLSLFSSFPHFPVISAFPDPNIFSTACSRTPLFNILSSVWEIMYICMYANLFRFRLILLLARCIIMYVCQLVQVDLTISTLRNYDNIRNIQYKVLVKMFKGKHNLEDLHLNGKSNIQIYHKGIGWHNVDWINLV